MASGDARPMPQKNVAYRVTFPIFDATGAVLTGAGSLDSEVSKDGGTFADCTNEATEIATSSGMYYLDLTSTEMNADTVAVIVKSASGKTTPIILYPEEAGDVRVNVTQISGDGTAADNAESFFDGTGYAGTNNVIPLVTTTTTATNLTNAATAGDLTATMKTSVTTAATAATPTATVSGDLSATMKTSVQTAATASLNAYDPPTRAELTSDVSALATAANLTTLTGKVDVVDGIVDDILVDTGTTVPAQISALNNISTAQVNAEVDAALADIHLDHLFANTYDPASKPGASDSWVNELTGNDGGVSQFTANALELAPSGTGASAASIVEAMFTVDTGETEATAVAGSAVYEIVQNAGGGSGLDAAGVRAAVGLASANLDTQLSAIDTVVDTILVDTNELQADWVNGGRLDIILDARASQTSVDTIDGIVDDILADTDDIGVAGAGLTALASAANLSTVSGKVDTVDTVVDAIKATVDTNLNATVSSRATQTSVDDVPTNAELGTAISTGLATYDGPTNAEMVARTLAAADYATNTDMDALAAVVADVDSNVEAILEDTGTDGVIVASIGNTALDSILNRTLTESYAADGAAPTMAQALIALVQMHTDHDVTDTTWRVRKLDGTTVAFTLTIDDPVETSVVRRTG